jgi:hypothetical protein
MFGRARFSADEYLRLKGVPIDSCSASSDFWRTDLVSVFGRWYSTDPRERIALLASGGLNVTITHSQAIYVQCGSDNTSVAPASEAIVGLEGGIGCEVPIFDSGLTFRLQMLYSTGLRRSIFSEARSEMFRVTESLTYTIDL